MNTRRDGILGDLLAYQWRSVEKHILTLQTCDVSVKRTTYISVSSPLNECSDPHLTRQRAWALFSTPVALEQ